ncbi:FecR family protein [Sphingomonas qomolangmaensis]|uniref:FecR domain-containing protein n=1 Tax=Sphingomonas qomolangmaensis TaxID=2918765 RepID=A0ABY5L8P6_9SPHN|nr:FecR domain-containing protein [Sphingomonas qomolangmaensis]UUL82521.1 FecR domain-containing protein [Sphingomonas qomolangmaensis]
MTIAEGQEEDRGEGLAREAAHWFAHMRSPDAEESRARFEAWLAEGPAHRVAYNRTAEIFAMGKLIAEPADSVPAPSPSPTSTPRDRRSVAAMAASVALVLGVGGWIALHPSGPAPGQREIAAGATDRRTISSIGAEARVVRLADGSTVRLGNRTLLDVDIGSLQRTFRLLQGQARFEVAHAPRPFVVYAGGGSVTARGTVFEVALSRSGKVDVNLVQGAVDVALPRRAATARPVIRTLSAGQGVSFAALAPAPGTTANAPVPTATNVVRDFEGVPVAELIALANRGAARPIQLADPTLASERVSGRFRIDDTAVLARRLGALFGRRVEVDAADKIVLAAVQDR